MSAFRLGLAFILAAAVVLPGLARGQDADMAGVAAAVRGDVQVANLAETVGRQVDSGDEIFLGDRVMSGVDSGMQILLLDETVFTVGPDAELVIDDFVYDPSTNAGAVAARVLRGAFRFTTGLVGQEDPDSVSIGTPLGTIGIRGTIVAGLVGQDQALIVLIGPGDEGATRERVGRIEVSNDQGSVEISRSGYGTMLDLNGGPPSDPVPVPPEAMAQILAAVGGEGQSDDAGDDQPASDESSSEDGEGDAAEDDEGGDEGSETADGESQSGEETADDDGAGQDGADTETAGDASDGNDGTAAETEAADAGAAPEESGSGETESASSNTSGSGSGSSGGSTSRSGSSGTSTTSRSAGSGGSLSSAVSGTSVSSLSGSSIDSAIGGSTTTTVAANTSSSASESTSGSEQTSSIQDGVTTVQDLVSVTTGKGVMSGSGNLTGTGTTGTFNFTGTADFGNRTLQFVMDATWTGTANGSFDLNAGPESYSEIFSNTNTVDMIDGGDEPFKSGSNGNQDDFSGLGTGESATVRIRIRNSGGVVAAAIDTQVEIDDNGVIITGSATGTR